MLVDGLTDASAVHAAAQEYRDIGRTAFRQRYGFGPAQRYWVVVDGRLYDAKSIVGAAYGRQHSESGPLRHDQFYGGEAGANPVLFRLGFTVVNSRPSSADEERTWRLALAQHLEYQKDSRGYVTADILREWGVYGGAQGVWVDAERTKGINPDGLAVAVLHTGLHYADDLTEDGILYHYPTTRRPGRRDESEVAAMKRAAEMRTPVFVISKPTPSSRWRETRLAWIDGWDDGARVFSMTFASGPPVKVQGHDDSDEQPFAMFGNTSWRKLASTRHRPDQRLFKLKVIQRYGARCPLSGVIVQEMLEAVHLVPDADGGAADPRNGLLMNAALHRAFDAGLFVIHPSTFAVITRPGLSAQDLGMTRTTIADLPKKPHPSALAWRYEWWAAQPKNAMWDT